jgi:hypothetical protein
MRRSLITIAATLGLGLAVPAWALAGPPGQGSGPHGCALADVNGNSPPVVHQSDTSTIGGNSCVFTQVPTNDGQNGGSYFVAAQSWSITACIPGVDPVTGKPTCPLDPSVNFGTGTGQDSTPQGQGVIPVGDKVFVTISNGVISVGTPNGAPGT